jgi:hypothetical protein
MKYFHRLTLISDELYEVILNPLLMFVSIYIIYFIIYILNILYICFSSQSKKVARENMFIQI